MSKGLAITPSSPAVLTANDLRSGRCVWMGGEGWTADPKAAMLYDDAGIADLALLDAEAQGHIVVGPYLVEATREGRPAHFREAFRHAGPSVETREHADA